VSRKVIFERLLITASLWALSALCIPMAAVELQSQTAPLTVTVGKSLVLDNALNIQRISLANGDLAEAVAVNPREVLINGKVPGETSLVVWQQGGPRLLFVLVVRASDSRVDNVRGELARELPGQDISVYKEGDTVFLHGTAKDLISAQRAAAMVAGLGKSLVNLLHVTTPAEDPQILLKVRFADVDRSLSSNLGFNLFSTGAAGNTGTVSTQQFAPALVTPPSSGSAASVTLTNALNIFLYRPDLNLGATIEALEAKNILQMLAEPNVLAMNGKPASFLSGGEFPVPVVQGGANVGAVTIQFREFGIRLNFLPTITPRGTIRLHVAPEVSSLDYSHGVVLNGFTVPAIASRKVETEIELGNGQTFGIAGLLDKNFDETLNKIPGIGDIPLLGKLFQSRTLSKTNSELLILVTPEIVRPIPQGQPVPEIPMPKPFLPAMLKSVPRTPGVESTGPVPVKPERDSVTMEELLEMQKKQQTPATGTNQVAPMLNPAGAPPAAAPPAGANAASPDGSNGTGN